MRQTFYISLLVLLIGCAFSQVFAQNKAEARYKKGKMIEISDLLSNEETQDCASKRYVGTVNAIQYKNNKQIESFALKTTKSIVKIYFSPALYTERLSTKDAKNLLTLISSKQKITVDTCICGASGKIILAMYIFLGNQPNTLGNL